MAKPWIIGAASFLVGAVTASGAWTAFPPSSKPASPSSATADPAGAKDESALEKANANLTASLHECDRRLAELGEHPVGTAPMPSAAAPSPNDSRGNRGGRREQRSLTKEDWERMAESGVVPTRVPCIRDKPWTPNERTADRLGLAPQDTEALKTAYEASNKRMNDQIRPLCAQVLGSAEAADKVGTSACIDVINNSARKANADATKASLTRVAEIQAGKREAPKSMSDAPPVEQLALVLTKESKTFEDELGQKLGPEEAKRLANDPALCADRHTLRASDESGPPGGFGRVRNGR